MKTLLGCEHCGRVVRRLHKDDMRTCGNCGRPFLAMGPDEAHVLQRERRVAEQFRRTAGFHRGRTGDATIPAS